MTAERDGGDFESGMVATGFWIGITMGRVILGFITPRIGEKLAISVSFVSFLSIQVQEMTDLGTTQLYVPAAIGFHLLFWLVPQFVASAVAVAIEGFFLGPLFPAVVVAATKLLPTHLHISAIGFAAALGGSGAAIFPFAVGVLAQAKGVQVLQPIIVALLAAILGIWALMPRIKQKKDAVDGDAERGRVSGVDAWRKSVTSSVTRSRAACAKLLKLR